MPRGNRLRKRPAGVAPRCFAVLRASGATRPHRCGRQNTAKPAGHEFTEAMLHYWSDDSSPQHPTPTALNSSVLYKIHAIALRQRSIDRRMDSSLQFAPSSTAAVAQLVESRIVIPVVVGSRPISRPRFRPPHAARLAGVFAWEPQAMSDLPTTSVFPSLEPGIVWKHFATLCAIPRASKEEARLRQQLSVWAEQRGLAVAVDAAGNLIIRKPASAGAGASPRRHPAGASRHGVSEQHRHAARLFA
jgi:hypothetical protein